MHLRTGARDVIHLHTVAEKQRTKAQTQGSNWASPGQPLLVLTKAGPWGHPGPCPGQTSTARPWVLAHTKHIRRALGQTSRCFGWNGKIPPKIQISKANLIRSRKPKQTFNKQKKKKNPHWINNLKYSHKGKPRPRWLHWWILPNI